MFVHITGFCLSLTSVIKIKVFIWILVNDHMFTNVMLHFIIGLDSFGTYNYVFNLWGIYLGLIRTGLGGGVQKEETKWLDHREIDHTYYLPTTHIMYHTY